MKQIYICFPQGKHKVFTLSYDDGCLADRRLVKVFNKYSVKATFHLNSGRFGINKEYRDRIEAEEVKELYVGHEVSAHTVDHPTIARTPKEELVYQILEDRRELEKLTGYPVRGLSYPNGSYNERIIDLLPHLGIEYSRITGGHETFNMPENYLKWQSTCHHNNKNTLSFAKEFINLRKTQVLYMFYVWGHSYEFDRDNSWGLIEELCSIVSKKEDIWYATNIEIVDYMKAAENLKFNVDRTQVINPSYLSVWIEIDGEKKELKPGLNNI